MLTRKEVKVILLTALVTLAIIGVFDKFIRTHQADRPETDHASQKFAALTSGECSVGFPSNRAHDNEYVCRQGWIECCTTERQ
jgi:hypothetical protein